MANHFGVDLEAIIQPAIDLYGLSFSQEYILDGEVGEQLAALTAQIAQISPDRIDPMGGRDFKAVMNFLRSNMSLPEVQRTVRSAADIDLRQAQRHWRAILRLVHHVLPEPLIADRDFLAIGFGRLVVPAILKVIQGGQNPEIGKSIHEIRKFILRHDVRKIYGTIRDGSGIDAEEIRALAELIMHLSAIWKYAGFPFSTSAEVE